MERQGVSSSMINSIGYDEKSQTLEVEFNTGAVYQYFEVEPETVDELLSASSHGKAFNEIIRDRYNYERK